MKIFVFILNILAVFAFILWFIFEPGWEPAVASFVAIVTFISQLFVNDKVNNFIFRNRQGRTKCNQIENMTQTGGDNSPQYQSGGDMTINNK